RGSGVSVHRVDCPNVASLKREPERMVEVEWGEKTSGIYLVQIQVEALDRSGLLSDITKLLTDTHVNILSASVGTSRARVAQSKFVFEMSDASHLDTVRSAVRKVEGVCVVYRISGGCTRRRPDRGGSPRRRRLAHRWRPSTSARICATKGRRETASR